MTTRIGVDIGGTFTDLVVHDDRSATTFVGKVATTATAPEQGVATALCNTVSADLVETAGYFLHGTTVGLNALLQRSGNQLGLLATTGFRDVLEVRRGDREAMYDVFWAAPPPLIPRHLRLPVRERILTDGSIHTDLCVADVTDAAEVFRRENVEVVAIAFINAYANPAHELAAAEALRRAGFDGEVSLSHLISREYREYERTATTVIDAYVRGPMTGYLDRLQTALAETGFTGTAMVTRSGGGAMTFAQATARPVETIMSGPVAGVEGAAELARTLELPTVITADVGGTSFDTSLIESGRPQLMYEGRVAGLPVQTPWIDVRSIGAGGGSIAHVDAGGGLRVGPRSAGADPGPACYGRGGSEPTVTDCALLLGMFGEPRLVPDLVLDIPAAERALLPVADAIDMSPSDAARAVTRIATAAMANAMREITIEQGIDPRDATLLAFGGAGPLLMTLLADELDLPRAIVPPHAGNFSAWGLLGADLTQTASHTRITPLSDTGLEQTTATLEGLFTTLADRNQATSDGMGSPEAALDLRYTGQEHTLTLPVPYLGGRIAVSAAELAESFAAAYERSYRTVLDGPVEIVSVRATLREPLPEREHQLLGQASPEEHTDRPTNARSCEAHSFMLDNHVPFRLLSRRSLSAGERVDGPAIVRESTTTTYLDAGFSAVIHPTGCLMVERVS